MSKYAVVIDLGGTRIKGALIDNEGEIAESADSETGNDAAAVLNNIKKLCHDMMSGCPGAVTGIGIGVPGKVNRKIGTIESIVNIPALNGLRLVEKLQEEFSIPVQIDNDATCAARGERFFGAGQQAANFICITLGTGVGAGLVVNGEVFTGIDDYAGEFGHFTVIPNGRRCNCGNYGCLERYSSGTAIVESAVSLYNKGLLLDCFNDTAEINPKTVEEVAKQGNLYASKIYHDAGTMLGIALASITNLLNLELCLIGGGVSNAGDPLYSPLQVAFNTHLLPVTRRSVQLKKAQLGNRAGMLGAASMVFEL